MTLPALSLVIALIAGGCGGSGSSSSSVPPSRGEFIKAANAICQKTRRDVQGQFHQFLTSAEAKELEHAKAAAVITAQAKFGRDVLIPARKREAAELRALTAPSGDEQEVEALLTAYEDGVKKAEKHPERAVKDGTEAFGESERMAGEYGLTAC